MLALQEIRIKVCNVPTWWNNEAKRIGAIGGWRLVEAKLYAIPANPTQSLSLSRSAYGRGGLLTTTSAICVCPTRQGSTYK
jgi:hypothetical protein